MGIGPRGGGPLQKFTRILRVRVVTSIWDPNFPSILGVDLLEVKSSQAGGELKSCQVNRQLLCEHLTENWQKVDTGKIRKRHRKTPCF